MVKKEEYKYKIKPYLYNKESNLRTIKGVVYSFLEATFLISGFGYAIDRVSEGRTINGIIGGTILAGIGLILDHNRITIEKGGTMTGEIELTSFKEEQKGLESRTESSDTNN